jgi:hypothetical protein
VLGADPLGRSVAQGQIYDITSTRQVNGAWVRDPFLGNIIRSNSGMRRQAHRFLSGSNQNLTTRVREATTSVCREPEDAEGSGDLRVDHRLSDKDSLFGSLSWTEILKEMPPPLPGPLDGTGFSAVEQHDQPRSAMLSWSRVWNPTLLTETRLAFTRLVTTRTQTPFKDPTRSLASAFHFRGGNEWRPAKHDDRCYTGFGLVDSHQSTATSGFVRMSRSWGTHEVWLQYPHRFPVFQVDSPHGNLTFTRGHTYSPRPRSGSYRRHGLLSDGAYAGQISTTNFISSEKTCLLRADGLEGHAQADLQHRCAHGYSRQSPRVWPAGAVRLGHADVAHPQGKDMDARCHELLYCLPDGRWNAGPWTNT